MLTEIIIGIVLGLSAGFSPGPLTTLVITQTLRHRTREGVKVAFSPLITDLPIVALSFLLIRQIGRSSLLGLISMAGGAFVLYLAWDCFKSRLPDIGAGKSSPSSISRGALVNFLNPNPYLFWMTVGAPTLSRALDAGPAAAAGFLAGFYLMLIGSKALIATLTGRTKRLMSESTYSLVMKLLGAMLVIFSLALLRDGLRHFLY